MLEAAPWVTPHDLGAIQSSAEAIMATVQTPPLLSCLWESYSSLLRESPVETKSMTAATLCFTGDAVAQLRSTSSSSSSTRINDENGEETTTFRYDPQRGMAFLAFGALYTGAFQHHWFEYLNTNVVDWGENIGLWGHPAETDIPLSYFVTKLEWWQYFDLKSQIQDVMSQLQDPPTKATLAATKVVVNQFAVIPLVYMPLFFAVSGALGGLNVEKSIARARTLYIPLLQRNHLFWVPVQFFQFYALPAEYQIPFVCVASLCWTIILSSIGGSTAPSESPVVYETVAPSELPPSSLSEVASYAREQQQLQQQASDQPVITVVPMDAGPVNELTDSVTLEDVQEALVPRPVREAVDTVGEVVNKASPEVGSSARGLAIGLLASAADEASLGTGVAQLLGVGTNVGVAVVTAVGAGVGFLAAAAAANTEGKDPETLQAPQHQELKSDEGSMHLQDAAASDVQVVFASSPSFEGMNSTATLSVAR